MRPRILTQIQRHSRDAELGGRPSAGRLRRRRGHSATCPASRSHICWAPRWVVRPSSPGPGVPRVSRRPSSRGFPGPVPPLQCQATQPPAPLLPPSFRGGAGDPDSPTRPWGACAPPWPADPHASGASKNFLEMAAWQLQLPRPGCSPSQPTPGLLGAPSRRPPPPAQPPHLKGTRGHHHSTAHMWGHLPKLVLCNLRPCLGDTVNWSCSPST